MESNQDPIILLPHILSKPKKEDEIEEKLFVSKFSFYLTLFN
jgi:hypothetical protein